MNRATMLVALLAMMLVAAIPALAQSTAYVPCSEMPSQEFAQGTLDDPAYNLRPGEEDLLNLDPDNDGIACNNEGNFLGDRNVENQNSVATPVNESDLTSGTVQYLNAR